MIAAPLAVAVPLLGAALLSVAATFASRVIANAIALVAATATLGLCVSMLLRAGADPLVVWFGGWHPRGGVALGVDFAVDDFAAGLAAFVAVLTVLALVMLVRYRATDPPHLQTLLLVFCAGMVGFCLSGDLFDMFVFFELMSVAAFALTGFRAHQEETITGALNFAVTNTVGSITLLLGIGLVYGRTGALNLAQIGASLEATQLDGLVVVALALIFTGFLIKAAVVPFHFWLADAYSVAPTPVCLLFAGAMSELGIYGIGRVWFDSFAGAFAEHAAAVGTVLITLGCLTALIGAAMCLAQDHLKRMLAFATIAYVGVFLVGLGAFSEEGVAGAALFIVSDGANKAALFAAVGIVQHRTASFSLRELSERPRRLLVPLGIFMLGALSFAALPPSGAFGAKSMIEEALKAGHHEWAVVVLLLVSIMTSAAILRAAARAFFGIGPAVADDAGGEAAADDTEGEDDEEDVDRDHTPLTLLVPAVLLAAGPLLIGAVPGVRGAFLTAASHFTDGAGYGDAVLGTGGPPAIPGSAGFAIPLESYVLAAVTVLGAVGLCALLLRPHVHGSAFASVRARVRAIGEPVRLLHSGHIGDYVAWTVAGLGLVGIALAAAAGFPR